MFSYYTMSSALPEQETTDEIDADARHHVSSTLQNKYNTLLYTTYASTSLLHC